MRKNNITHKINENGDIIFELQDIMGILFELGKQQFAINLSRAFADTEIVTDEVFNYTKFKKVDKSRIQRTRGVGNRAMRVCYDLEDILADYESTQIVTVNELEEKRRKEVLKYADMLFFNQKDTRIALFGYDVAIETAEIIVKSRDKYLKDGKLC